MSGWSSTWLVAQRELRETFRRRTFWLIIAAMLIGSTAAMVVPGLLDDGKPPKYKVGVVDAPAGFPEALEQVGKAADVTFEVTDAPDRRALRQSVEADTVEIGLVVAAGEDRPTIITGLPQTSTGVLGVQQALAALTIGERLAAAGLDPTEAAEAMAVPTPRFEELDEEQSGRQTVAFVTSFILYLLLLSLMIQVANGVAVEKSNRISEVLLAVVRPSALLFGKVVGVVIVGLMTILAVAVPVLTKMVLGGSLPEGTLGSVAATALWFFLGLALYLTIAGALGALADRQEQAGSIVAPMTFLLIGTFVLAQSSADSTLGAVLAIFPLTSPLMMPFRIALGAAGPAEIAASLLALVVTIALAAKVGSLIYGRAIVRTGRRLKLREILRPL